MLQNSSNLLFSSLAEPRRRKIVELLADRGQMSATDISNQFEISPAAISQHLKILREARVIQMERQARRRLYTLNARAFDELEEWVRQMKTAWSARFDALDALLEK
ncbi:MAG: metalloregulator ArsR/SmtB family transcription factor [Patescibacteria group bacterium]